MKTFPNRKRNPKSFSSNFLALKQPLPPTTIKTTSNNYYTTIVLLASSPSNHKEQFFSSQTAAREQQIQPRAHTTITPPRFNSKSPKTPTQRETSSSTITTQNPYFCSSFSPNNNQQKLPVPFLFPLHDFFSIL